MLLLLLMLLCVCVCDSFSQQVQRKVGLVYGGGSIGLMGKIAGTVHTGGGKVTGYVPLRQSLCRFNLASQKPKLSKMLDSKCSWIQSARTKQENPFV
jgi:hypothetical protein